MWWGMRLASWFLVPRYDSIGESSVSIIVIFITESTDSGSLKVSHIPSSFDI